MNLTSNDPKGAHLTQKLLHPKKHVWCGEKSHWRSRTATSQGQSSSSNWFHTSCFFHPEMWNTLLRVTYIRVKLHNTQIPHIYKKAVFICNEFSHFTCWALALLDPTCSRQLRSHFPSDNQLISYAALTPLPLRFHLSHPRETWEDRFPPWCEIQFVLICLSENAALSHVKSFVTCEKFSKRSHFARDSHPHHCIVPPSEDSHFHISLTHRSLSLSLLCIPANLT